MQGAMFFEMKQPRTVLSYVGRTRQCDCLFFEKILNSKYSHVAVFVLRYNVLLTF